MSDYVRISAFLLLFRSGKIFELVAEVDVGDVGEIDFKPFETSFETKDKLIKVNLRALH